MHLKFYSLRDEHRVSNRALRVQYFFAFSSTVSATAWSVIWDGYARPVRSWMPVNAWKFNFRRSRDVPLLLRRQTGRCYYSNRGQSIRETKTSGSPRITNQTAFKRTEMVLLVAANTAFALPTERQTSGLDKKNASRRFQNIVKNKRNYFSCHFKIQTSLLFRLGQVLLNPQSDDCSVYQVSY